MKGVTFGEYHSYRDFKLILSSKEIEAPAVKEMRVDIQGADSDLDLTEFFGEPKYSNARHKFNFTTVYKGTEFLSAFAAIKNAIHGKKKRVILDDDPSFYYVGRLFVTKFTDERNIGILQIEADCEPYKYKLQPTIMSVTVDGTQAVSLTNARKRAVPEVVIDTAASLRIEYQGNIWDLGSGSFTLPELELVEGENTVTVTGTGTVTFSYQEGAL
jgi:phage-related protein